MLFMIQAIYTWDEAKTTVVKKIWNCKCEDRLRDGLGKARARAKTLAGTNDWNWNALKPHCPRWIPPQVWGRLIDEFWSKEAWVQNSGKASTNRKSTKHGGISKHTGGSCPFAVHKYRLVSPF